MRKQEQRKEGELLQVNLDVWGKDETIKEKETREMSLQHKTEKLKQGILQMHTSNLIIYSTFILEWELKLEQSEEKIKLLESNVTKLDQTTEKWKKGN